MGTDIHGIFQRRNTETKIWEDLKPLPKQDIGRHYRLFAILAGVHNGSGFAGIRTGDAVTPIAIPRGLPDDFTVMDGDKDTHLLASIDYHEPWRQEYRSADDPEDLKLWMGNHSYSWLTTKEMLQWYNNAPVVTQYGVMSREEYEAWDKTSKPDSYCGDIAGGGIIVAEGEGDIKNSPNFTHIRVQWPSPLKDELKYFFDWVAEYDKQGEVRYVFGFDS